MNLCCTQGHLIPCCIEIHLYGSFILIERDRNPTKVQKKLHHIKVIDLNFTEKFK